MPELEGVIGDLFHPSIEIRKKALANVKKFWQIEMRPYLWLAIEEEKNSRFQSKLVEFITKQLKEKSLPKMIRFVENGTLSPISMKVFLKSYLEYENSEVRGAMIKSLKREKSKTNQFVNMLIKSKHLRIEESRYNDLITEILSSSLSENYRYNFSRLIIGRKDFSYQNKFGECFLENFKNDPIIRKALLEGINHINLIWLRNDWSAIEKAKLLNIDKFIIESANNPNSKLREQTILILSKLFIKGKITKNSQLEVIYDFWSKLTQWQKDEDFLYLENYDKKSLSEFFTEEYENQLNEFFMFDIHPYLLLNHILAYLPRKRLLQLAKEDPIVNNRVLCYQGLTNSYFWVIENKEDDILFIGPHSFWVNTINRCIIALKYEHKQEVWITCISLLNFLSGLLQKLSERNFNRIKSLLMENDIVSKLDDLQNYTFSASISIQMKMLFGIPVKIDKTNKLSPDTVKLLFNQLLMNLKNNSFMDSLLNVMDGENKKIRQLLISEISRMIDNDLIVTDEMEQNIKIILQKGLKDEDIRIRSYARLLINKL